VPGMELWGTEGPLYSAAGAELGENPGTCNFAVYWDGDPQRELMDVDTDGRVILYKWDAAAGSLNVQQFFEGDLVAHGDVFGDWREEVVTAFEGELRVYTTVEKAELRVVTLPQDPTYRLGAALETMGALLSPQPGFSIDE
jgi:hypothetical protein